MRNSRGNTKIRRGRRKDEEEENVVHDRAAIQPIESPCWS